ncbi:MAG TPA: STAS domain-containing protein [Bryobacteraceae bacterium]|jgi:anti-anti-sigma factor
MAFTVDGSRTDRAVILTITGRVDAEAASELELACRQWLSPDDRNLVLDFSGLQYISSAGLGSVLAAGKEIDRRGGRLLICALPGRIKPIFVFTGIDSLFPLFENRNAALADCAEKK